MGFSEVTLGIYLAVCSITPMAVGTLDPDVGTEIVTLAGDYADRVIASLPEEDSDVLHAGLVGAFVTFFVEAAGAFTNRAA